MSAADCRTILHVDLDAFFAAVEVRENPDLAGKPVIVGADPRGGRGRGVVAAASYEARRFGVHSAMPISHAYRRCPHGVYVQPRHTLYATVSRRFMGILRRYTDQVEPLSIDEAFLDVTASASLFGDGTAIARQIKEQVRQEQSLTASIGVAPTKFVAKIASDVGKPDGLVVVEPSRVSAFLAELPVERLWGAGRKTIARLHQVGLFTIGDVARTELAELERTFGASTAEHFHALSHGMDPRPVVADRRQRSLGRETTFGVDVQDRATVLRTLLSLVEELTQRLRRHELLGQAVTLKLRTTGFVTVTRQMALPIPADTTEVIWPVARQLFVKADTTSKAIRLVGVSVSIASREKQLALVDPEREDRPRKIARALDAVTARFGQDALRRAVLLEGQRSAAPKPALTKRGFRPR